MEDKNEKEIKRFSYERPVLVSLSSSDFELYRGAQCNSGSSAAVDCDTGLSATTACTNGASVV